MGESINFQARTRAAAGQGALMSEVHQAAAEMARRLEVISHRRQFMFATGSRQEFSRQVRRERRHSFVDFALWWACMTPAERVEFMAPLWALGEPRRSLAGVLLESAEASEAFAAFDAAIKRAKADGQIEPDEAAAIDRAALKLHREVDDARDSALLEAGA